MILSKFQGQSCKRAKCIQAWNVFLSFINYSFGKDGDSIVVQSADCEEQQYDISVLSVVTLHCFDSLLKNK